MGGSSSSVSAVRAGLAVSVSVAALSIAQPALAQFACGDGSPGPLCIIDNTGPSGAIAGTIGTATLIQNSGTITGTPAIAMGGSSVLSVDNAAGGVIDGDGGNAIVAVPRLFVGIKNAGTISGNVVVDDQPAINVFTAGTVAYFSDGGTLNGDLQLGTTGFSSAHFFQRGADDGVTGAITAGSGIDVYFRSYRETQSAALGANALPATFEVDGYEVLGGGTTLTLTGTGTTVSLTGDGHVVNEAEIGLLDTASLFPQQVEVVPPAIGSYQPNNATFRREQIPLGQPNGFFVVPYGSALASFTNNGVVNGDIRIGTASFVNNGELNLSTHSAGTIIRGAANTDFLFRNTGTIEFIDNGARTAGSAIEAEFEDGVNAAVRLRSALDTLETRAVRIENSGEIDGGLDAVFAASDFVFENSGSISGIETGSYFSRGLSINVGELDLVVGEDPVDEFNGNSASILNTATGVINHGFGAVLNTSTATVENRGTISASGQEGGIALYVEHGLLTDDETVDPSLPEPSATSLSVLNSGTINGKVEIDGETADIAITNSGQVTAATLSGPYDPGQDFFENLPAFSIYNESDGDHVLAFTNSGSILNQQRGGTGVGIEVEAGDDEPTPGAPPLIGSADVRVVNSGTISATGGAIIAINPVFNLPQGTVLVNPIAALAVDASDVTGNAVITIENQAGATISVGGNVSAATQIGFFDNGPTSAGSSAVAVAASARVVNITNAGRIEGGTGTDYSDVPSGTTLVFNNIELRDNYLAGAIQTSGDEYLVDGSEVYIGSIDKVTNTATGEIIGSIDLGANDDVIENYGSITGDVFLREGNDRFVQSLLGSFTGIADGGAGEDSLAFDITGSDGIVDQLLRDRFVNFELFSIVGTGAVQSNEEVVVAEGGTLELTEGSNIDVGAGNTAISGSETVGETVSIAGTITGNIDMRGGNNVVANTGQVNGDVSFGDGSNTVANQGQITGNLTLGQGGNSVANGGQIAGNVVSGGGNDSFANSGTVTGNVDLGGGDDELVLTGDWAIGGTVNGGEGVDMAQVTFTGTSEQDLPELDLSGFQQIEQFNVNGGTGKVGGTATFEEVNINGGRLIGAAGSTITGDVDVGSGGTFGSAGTVVGDVSVGAGGTFSPGASPAVMNITGNVALAGGSVTTFEFVPAPGQSDQILIDGNLTIASGATINLTGDRPLTPGAVYDMIVADSITGTFTVGAWDRSAVQGFLRYTPTSLQLLGTFVAPVGVSAQAGAAIDYVNSLLISGQASTAVLNAVPSLLNAQGFASASAFGQLTPEAYASASQLGVDHGLGIAKAVRTGGAASTREEAGLFSFAQALGDWRKLKGDAGTGVSRATSHSYGMLGGIGYGSAGGSIGAFIGYVDSRQRIAGLGARTEADGLIAGVSGHVAAGGWDFNALLAYDWSDARTRRSVPGNVDVSSSKYDLRSLILDASAGYSLKVSNGWAVRPELGITHISTRRGAAIETGSPGFALAVDRDRTRATFIDGAIALRGSGATFQPWAQVGLRHQLEGGDSVATAGFAGSASRFTVLGASRKDTVATVGAGFNAELTAGMRLFAAYQGDFGGGDGHGLNAGIRLAF